MALSTGPYHYVEAGAFLTRCGEAFSELAYTPVLETVPNRDKCGACRSQMDDPSPAFAHPITENAP